MLNVAHGLAKNADLRVDLVVADLSGAYVDQVGSELNLVDLGAGRISRSPKPLRSYLRDSAPEVIISGLDLANLTAIGVARSLRDRPRVIVTEHSTLSIQLGTSRPSRRVLRLLQSMLPRLINVAYRFADQVVAVSHGVADDLAETTGLPRDRVLVVGNPVVTPEVRVKAQQPATHPWLTDQDGPPVIVGVGRLSLPKNFPLLLRAFARLRSERDARLLILGEGPDRDELERLADELGISNDVSMPGFVDNPYAEMAAADVFALSSEYEGLPTVLIEALFCDTPVVSTDCKAGPRQILDGGLHGKLVPVGDLEALVEALNEVLDNIDEAQRQTGWEPFTEEAIIAEYTDLVNSLDTAAPV